MTLSAACYAAGYLTGLLAFFLTARRRGLATEGIMILAGAGLVGGLLCANLAQWVFTGAPGKTILGGIVGGYLCVALAKHLLGIRRPTGDLFAVAVCAGEAVGRWGCFFGGCCYGRPTHVAWAVWQHGCYRHPTQIYLSLVSLLMLGLLLCYERAGAPENGLFALQGLLYCASRFVIEFFREQSVPAGSFSTAQWACLAGLLFFTWKLHQVRRSKSYSLPKARNDAGHTSLS